MAVEAGGVVYEVIEAEVVGDGGGGELPKDDSGLHCSGEVGVVVGVSVDAEVEGEVVFLVVCFHVPEEFFVAHVESGL